MKETVKVSEIKYKPIQDEPILSKKTAGLFHLRRSMRKTAVTVTFIGVATAKQERNQGYAKACVSKLCEEIVAAEKRVLLFYNNPAAGKLYKSPGFVDINGWMTGKLQK